MKVDSRPIQFEMRMHETTRQNDMTLFRKQPLTGHAFCLRVILVLGFVLLQASWASAASDGSFGLTSQATTVISIIRGETAQASGLQDIILAPWSDGDPPPVGIATACIYTSTGSYQVTASSANGAGTNFRLAAGTSFMNYVVGWNDGVAGLVTIANGIPTTGLIGDTSSTTCNGTNPATIQVQIPGFQIQNAPIGNYGDTLTVIITPQ